MAKGSIKGLDIQPEEVRVFLWSALLVFLIRGSTIIFDNFGETAFLKRFGVEYLPLVYIANSVATFFAMGFLTGIMRRTSNAKLLGGMLVFCGASVALLRLVVMTDFTMVYPVIFVLKAQYEALLSLAFWNLANDLFNTRQSKRIFPLLTAGGVLGGIAGSFGTAPLAKLITLNNLMVVYLFTCLLATLVVWGMSRRFPTLNLEERAVKKHKGERAGMIDEFRKVIPLIKESTLVKILVLLTLIPNILIPLANYQFNFAVNEAFATEGGMIHFFSVFRGFLNIISLVILLFVGKLYSRWGLPVALMFHPANYIIAFLALLLRFDIVSAMYQRISTNTLRTTINNPARDILMGLFPADQRPLMRPFLRGTVVRIGVLVGSGFIMLCEGNLHPRYLSVVGIIFGVGWMATSVWLKRDYSKILLDLVARNVLDLKSLENSDLGKIFQDKRSQRQLMDACREAQGQTCVWYAEMLTSQSLRGADDGILELLAGKDEETVTGLLPLVPPSAGAKALAVYRQLADPRKPLLSAALARAATRLPDGMGHPFLAELLAGNEDLLVQAEAVAGLYPEDPARYGAMIQAWLDSPLSLPRRAGALAAGGAGDARYLPRLRELLTQGGDPELEAQTLIALRRLGDPGLNELILERMRRGLVLLPREVVADLPSTGDPATNRFFIELLGHESREISDLALAKLREAPEPDPQMIIAALATPNRRQREGLFALMEALKISDLEIIAYARSQTEAAYRDLSKAAAIASLPEHPARELLRAHLTEQKQTRLEFLLRVLSSQDKSAKMRIIMRGLSSSDARQRSNAVEALESMLGRQLSTALIPLLEDAPLADTMAKGRKLFSFPADPPASQVLAELLAQGEWVARYLALTLVAREKDLAPFREALAALAASEPAWIAGLAKRLLANADQSPEAYPMVVEAADKTSLSEKILKLRAMDLFEGLKVSELAAVAAVTEERLFTAGETIIQEGEVGETMYLIIKGTVSVHKLADDGCEVELDKMGEGHYFGEMALFDDEKRSATIRAEDQVHVLSLHKREFAETVREYPQVALQICKELGKRLRKLHEKIKTLPICLTDDKLLAIDTPPAGRPAQ